MSGTFFNGGWDASRYVYEARGLKAEIGSIF